MKFLFIICCVLLFCLIILFPTASIKGAANAIRSWLTVVLPSLMPFFIAASLLVQSGIVSLFSSFAEPVTKRLFGFSGYFAYVFLTAALSGYPMGAKLSAELYEQGKISEKEARALVNCTSVSGPLFMIGAVCIGMIGNADLAIYLLFPHYASALILAAFAGIPFRSKTQPFREKISEGIDHFIHKNPLADKHIGGVLLDSVSSAITSMLTIGGFMVLFEVLLWCLQSSGLLGFLNYTGNPPLFYSLIAGTLEMTSGCLNTGSLALTARLIVLSGIISFGGLSIHSQTYAITAQRGLKLKGFSLYKCAQALLSAFMTWGMLSIARPSIAGSTVSRGSLLYLGAAFLLFCIFAIFAIKTFIYGSKARNK